MMHQIIFKFCIQHSWYYFCLTALNTLYTSSCTKKTNNMNNIYIQRNQNMIIKLLYNNVASKTAVSEHSGFYHTKFEAVPNSDR